MATYFTNDFADFSGSGPVDYGDWTARYNTGGTAWSIASSYIEAGTAATNDWNCLTWDDVDGDANRATVDVLTSFRFSNISQRRYPLIVRGSGADETATHYSIAVFSNNFRVYICNGSDTPVQVATATLGFSFAVDTDYWIRFRANGSTLKAKVWTGLASDEPGGAATDASWTVTGSDSTISAAGWIGFGSYSAAAGVPKWRQIGVGTNGDFGPSAAASGLPTLSAATPQYADLTATSATIRWVAS